MLYGHTVHLLRASTDCVVPSARHILTLYPASTPCVHLAQASGAVASGDNALQPHGASTARVGAAFEAAPGAGAPTVAEINGVRCALLVGGRMAR